MLKIDGNQLMDKFHVKPGPVIGWTLNALLEEVLDDSSLNSEEHLNNRAQKLIALPEEELKKLGESGKKKREEKEEEEIQKILENNHVS
jgi:hypothetical protein